MNEKPLLSVFYQSIVVEVTNPKTALFFIALLPQFVMINSGPVSQQLLILGAIVTISALPCDILVAMSSRNISKWIVKHKRAEQIQNRISGSILGSMGTYIVADEVTK
jgi:threonine/homoserine/homoserine lactone efflux protein